MILVKATAFAPELYKLGTIHHDVYATTFQYLDSAFQFPAEQILDLVGYYQIAQKSYSYWRLSCQECQISKIL